VFVGLVSDEDSADVADSERVGGDGEAVAGGYFSGSAG